MITMTLACVVWGVNLSMILVVVFATAKRSLRTRQLETTLRNLARQIAVTKPIDEFGASDDNEHGVLGCLCGFVRNP